MWQSAHRTAGFTPTVGRTARFRAGARLRGRARRQQTKQQKQLHTFHGWLLPGLEARIGGPWRQKVLVHPVKNDEIF
jgi:hypothetical protein